MTDHDSVAEETSKEVAESRRECRRRKAVLLTPGLQYLPCGHQGHGAGWNLSRLRYDLEPLHAKMRSRATRAPHVVRCLRRLSRPEQQQVLREVRHESGTIAETSLERPRGRKIPTDMTPGG